MEPIEDKDIDSTSGWKTIIECMAIFNLLPVVL